MGNGYGGIPECFNYGNVGEIGLSSFGQPNFAHIPVVKTFGDAPVSIKTLKETWSSFDFRNVASSVKSSSSSIFVVSEINLFKKFTPSFNCASWGLRLKISWSETITFIQVDTPSSDIGIRK